jgi:hypothetical protein
LEKFNREPLGRLIALQLKLETISNEMRQLIQTLRAERPASFTTDVAPS